jgi:hypothetical protein
VSLKSDIEAIVAQQLGRAPQGLQSVAVWRGDHPAVIHVAPIVRQQPFPTTFWLTDPALNLALDRLEAGGAIAAMQAQVDLDPALVAQMAEDHRVHQTLRQQLWTPAQAQEVAASAFAQVFESRGIGGIEADNRIRCLHTWMASHLVVSNVIGEMTEPLLPEGLLDDLTKANEFTGY